MRRYQTHIIPDNTLGDHIGKTGSFIKQCSDGHLADFILP